MSAFSRRLVKLETKMGTINNMPILIHRTLWKPGKNGAEQIKPKGYMAGFSDGSELLSLGGESLDEFKDRVLAGDSVQGGVVRIQDCN